MSASAWRFGCLAFALALGALPAPATAVTTLPGPYAATVERVVDGDTLGVRITIWLQQDLTVLVRIRGIDAPELRGRCDRETARARAATTALQRLVSGGLVVLTSVEGDKYFGRVVADVATPEGEDIAAALVAAGHARPYDGGARRSWCEVGALEGEAAGGVRFARY